MDAITESTIEDLAKAGRTITNTATVQIDERAGLGSTMKLVTGGKMRPDRFDVVVAHGPTGPEAVIWPLMASTPLPGEYHTRLRGALATPVTYGETLLSSNWQSPDRELQKWLRKEKFDAYMLPNEMKQGFTKVGLDHVVDLYPEASDRSRLVITLGGMGGIGSVKVALTVSGLLAPSVAMSMTTGRQRRSASLATSPWLTLRSMGPCSPRPRRTWRRQGLQRVRRHRLLTQRSEPGRSSRRRDPTQVSA